MRFAFATVVMLTALKKNTTLTPNSTPAGAARRITSSVTGRRATATTASISRKPNQSR